jgi:hypothetical protein
MNYTAPDGHIMTSSPTEPVVYTCQNIGLPLGNYNSVETQSSDNSFGIEQIKVTRHITPTEITITIVQSTDAELQAYIDSIVRNDEISQTTIDDILN